MKISKIELVGYINDARALSKLGRDEQSNLDTKEDMKAFVKLNKDERAIMRAAADAAFERDREKLNNYMYRSQF